MPSLATIDAKLSELVNKAEAEKAEKEPTEEEKDEERLREIEAKLVDLTELLEKGVTRQSADEQIKSHEARVDSTKDEDRPLLRVFHDHKGKKIPTTRRTQAKMHLADALKLRIRVGKHAQDLEHALHVLVREQVDILRRQLSRVGSKKSNDK